MKQRHIECKVIHTSDFTFVARKGYPEKDEFFIDENNVIKHCRHKGYNMFGGDIYEDTEGNPYIEPTLVICGTNDIGFNKLGVPKIPNLYEKLENIKVKFEEYGYHTVLEGGIDLGTIGYHLRPVLTQNGQIITSF